MDSIPAGPALRAVVIEDEPLARDGLAASIRALVAEGQLPPIDVVATADSGVSGTEAILRERPDVALVDIAMPRMSGMEMVERLEPEATPPALVFVTAYGEHALQAFGVRALDYLVKPVPEARLRDALLRAATRVAEVRALRASLEAPAPLPGAPAAPYLRQIVIPDRGVRLVVPVDEVEWIEGETYYVRVHTATRGRLLRERLGALEAALDPAVFFRSHRSALVRLDRVREIRADGPYSSHLVLASGARAPLARDRMRALEERIGGGRAKGG
jgi:two-component system LytT family response regulator